MPTAYSYMRFSKVEQAAGDSIRRQTEARDIWLKAHPDVPLDTTLALTDAGKGAFERKNWQTYALAGFVRAIESGVVEQGDYLLLENLDRLSREEEEEAMELFLSIINKRVVIVQLMPTVTEFRKGGGVMSMIQAMFEFSRGHGESKLKSQRVASAWDEKRKDASKKVLTRRVPGWIRYDDATESLVCDPTSKSTVERIFELAITGNGVGAIAKRFNEEGVPVLGRKTFKKKPVRWNETVVYGILTSHGTYGTYRPGKGRGDRSSDRKLIEGAEVHGYYPAAVTKETFDRAALALASRKGKMAGRRGSHINLFAGLIWNARDGGALTYAHRPKLPDTIVSVAAKQTGAQWTSFPATAFDSAVLDSLAELTTADVHGDDEASNNLAAIAGRVARLDAQIRLWTDQMDKAEDAATVDQITTKLNGWNATRRVLVQEQAIAQREANNPVAEAAGECKSLIVLMSGDKSGELRTKTKAALRRLIESAHCLFTNVGRMRLAAVRLQFRGGRHRNVLIVWHPPTSNHRVKRPGRLEFRSIARDDCDGDINDLRSPANAVFVEEWLKHIAPQIVTEGLDLASRDMTGYPRPAPDPDRSPNAGGVSEHRPA